MRNIFLIIPMLWSCSDDKGGPKINLYTVQDDIELGQQLREEILADPITYPILSSEEYPDAYDKLYDIRDSILASGEVRYLEEFDWELFIIEDDEVLNAFCAPGGYIYVYTGLIKFLESLEASSSTLFPIDSRLRFQVTS